MPRHPAPPAAAAAAAADAPAAILRPLTPGMLGALHALEQSASAHPWSLANFASSLREGHWAQGLWLGDALIGHCIAMPGHAEAHLLNIATAPAHRGQGLARRMLAALNDWAQAAGAEKTWLEVRHSNTAAQRLYRQWGFAPVGVRKGYYPCRNGQREDAIVMCLTMPHRPPCPATPAP